MTRPAWALAFDPLARAARRSDVLVVGSILVVLGLALLVLPGPGILVSLLGLALLAVEFAWARRILERIKARTRTGETVNFRATGEVR